MSKISRFTTKAVTLAKNAVGGRNEAAAPEGGGGFAEYAVVSLHCLRVYLAKSYRETLDLLSEMPQIIGEIGLEPANLPDHSTLVKWFERIKTALWRVLLRLPAQLHETSGHAAIDATFFDLETASKHYRRRTDYRVQTLKTTALVDTESNAILNAFCPTKKRHDTQFGWQIARPNAGDLHSLAADKGYDWKQLRENLREESVGPCSNIVSSGPSITRTTPGSMGLDTPTDRCVKPSSRRSSARSATPCVCEPCTANFGNSS